MAWQDNFNDTMRRMMKFITSVKEQRMRNVDHNKKEDYTALDAAARLATVALQSQIEAQQRGMAILLRHFKEQGIHLQGELEEALKLTFPTFHDEPDDIDPQVIPPVIKHAARNEYGNWRWKIDRLAGLFGTKVMSKANVRWCPTPDHNNNPDAVIVSKIKSEREFDLLYEWARNYLGSINVGGGQKPDGTWWVRLDHNALKERNLGYPVGCFDPYEHQEPTDIDPEVAFCQLLIGHSPLSAAQWTWPVRFDLEYLPMHHGPDRVRVQCAHEGNRYALYHAACSIIGVESGDDLLKGEPWGFYIVRNGRQFIEAMPEAIRLKLGNSREFEFTRDKQGVSK